MSKRHLIIASASMLAPLLSPATAADRALPAGLIVDLSPQGQRAAFRPALTMGAAIDGTQQGDTDRLFTAHNIAAMKKLGLRALTYRLRTELGIETWHWNPRGEWSDPVHQQGYWTSDDRPGAPIGLSWGYKLPRRGDSVDNANDTDYSRLTDGDPKSFWKSNPYLDPVWLHDNRDHPQWLVVRLGKPFPIDTAVIAWGEPYATRYKVQYWTARTEDDNRGKWRDFPNGDITDGRGGKVALSLAGSPVTARFLRVLLLSGSNTAAGNTADWRDKAGYAVKEVSFGTRLKDGSFHDDVVHVPDHVRQTFTHVSSTDPWHRKIDRDADLEQVGIDRLFASGLGGGVPVMMPTGLLYDTPENIAAELRYIMRRHFPVARIELGEEPDGQYGEAADYGALYLAAVDRLRPIPPRIRFGGPSLQSASTENWMSPGQPADWTGRFVAYLRSRGRLSDLGFLSFEDYPFDDICGDIHAKLLAQNHMMDDEARELEGDGVPRDIPWIISEYGFSAYSGRAMSEISGALLMANIVGQWLTQRGDPAYMFGYGPNPPSNQHLPCAGYGEMSPFLADEEGQADGPTATFYTARMLTQDWTVPGMGLHRAVAMKTQGLSGEEVRGYALRRPDGRLGLLILNRSPDRTYNLPIYLRNDVRNIVPLTARASIVQYGAGQYRWLDKGTASHPSRNLPPVRFEKAVGPSPINLPPDSITVLVTNP